MLIRKGNYCIEGGQKSYCNMIGLFNGVQWLDSCFSGFRYVWLRRSGFFIWLVLRRNLCSGKFECVVTGLNFDREEAVTSSINAVAALG